MRATAIIPVKRFGQAKQRLLATLERPQRAALVKAMLSDVLRATTDAREVNRVIVVTAEVLQERDDHGHPEAATLGIVRARALDAGCVALLPGDCPLLDAAELDAALERMRPGRVAVIPDRHGTGTNALLMSPPDAIGPAFGPGSRERHSGRAERAGHEVAAMAAILEEAPERAPATAAELVRQERIGSGARR
jgi:2-phospho-L-lactate guanylyltransferase